MPTRKIKGGALFNSLSLVRAGTVTRPYNVAYLLYLAAELTTEGVSY